MNKNKAYILGVLFGDGCIRVWKGKPLGIVLKVGDKDFAEYFCKMAKKEGYNPKIAFKIQDNKNNLYCNKLFRHYKVDINNTQFAKECFVLVNKRKSIPKEIFNSDIECKKMFIKGVMDSEGWISIHRRKDLKRGYGYSMGFGVKDNFIYGLHRLFKEVGIRVNKVLLNKQNKILYFHIRMWDYYDSKIGFSIKRKQDRLNDFGKNFSRIVGYPKGMVAHNRKSDITKEKVIELKKNLPIIEIAQKLNCSHSLLYNRLKE